MSHKNIKTILACLPISLLATDPTLGEGLQEVVVTGQRVESNLQDTPAAISVLSAESLNEAGISELAELEGAVPNVSTNNSDRLQIIIRGITSNDFTEKGDPSASVMFDGVYIARPQAQNVILFDVERVEFLRGPQGTLWGRNTTAGVINKITAKPVNEFKAAVNATVGDYGARQSDAMINLPVNDKFALRLALSRNQRDSYIKDSVEQQFPDDPARDDTAGRLSASWDINDDINLLMRADYADAGGTFGGETGILLANNYGPVIPGEVTRQIGDKSDDMRTRDWQMMTSPEQNNHTWGVVAELNWSLPSFDVAYLGSYRELHRDEGFVKTIVKGSTNANYRQSSHEVRILFAGDSPLIGQAGLYYFEEESDIVLAFDDYFIYFPDYGPSVFAFSQDPTIAENKAVFAQATYAFTDQLNVTAGVRYSEDRKERTGSSALVSSLQVHNPDDAFFWLSNSAHGTWSKTTWRLGFDYHANDDNMVFGSIATGYKAGGFNDGCEAGTTDDNGIFCNQVRSPDDLYYKPEELTAYEFGMKSSFWDNHLRVNGTVFYYDYSNMQLSGSVFLDNAPQLVIKNAGKARVKGLEVEMKYLLAENHKFDLAFSLLDGKYREYDAPVGDGSTSLDFSGYDMDRTPDFTLSLGYTYTQNLSSGGDVDYRINSQYSDSYVIANRAAIYEQPSFTKTDASVTYHSDDASWYLRAFGKNLENKIQLGSVTSSTLYGSSPRTWGVGAGYKF